MKYQVFVSSTYEDLKAEREQVVKAILEMGHIPVGMEMFSAADQEQWPIIQRHIESSDYYIVIVAHRYGSIDGDRSFTEKEYDYAIECNVPVLGFVITESAPWPADRTDKGAKQEALQRFKEKVMKRYISTWTSKDTLYGQVSIALTKQMTAKPRTGWIRGDQAAGAEVLEQLARLTKENAELRAKLAGAGPSSAAARELLREFIAKLYDWRRAEQILRALMTTSSFHKKPGEENDWERTAAEASAAADKALVMLEMELPGTQYVSLLPRAYELFEAVRTSKGPDHGAIRSFAIAVSKLSAVKE